jgi:Flp pilus assembly protein TadD
LTEVNRFNEALTQFEEAERIDATDARLHFQTGLALSRAGDPAGAALRYVEAIKRSPNYADARNNLGVVLTELDRFDEALAQFRKAVEISPNYSDARKNLAVALARAGDAAGAIANFEEVIRLSPDDFEVYPPLAELYVRTNQPQRALATAQRAVTLARSAGQTLVAEEIEAWRRKYQTQVAGGKPSFPATSTSRSSE